MLWKSILPDGSEIFIDKTYLPSKWVNRVEREYIVKIRKSNNSLDYVCLLGEQGNMKKWYHSYIGSPNQKMIENIINSPELVTILLAEQIHNT